MTELYRDLCNLFIRPTRQQYSTYDLGNLILSQDRPYWRAWGSARIST